MKDTAAHSSQADAEAQLRRFIAKFEPEHQRLIRGVRSALRKRLPTATELAYDNYNFFVIGYSPTDRPSDAILSVTANAKGVGLCFIQGARLRDPTGILLGSGKQTRFIRVDAPAMLRRRDVEGLISAAIANATTAFPPKGRVKLIIRSVSSEQRPRRS